LLYTLVQYITEQQVCNITDSSHFNHLAMTVVRSRWDRKLQFCNRHYLFQTKVGINHSKFLTHHHPEITLYVEKKCS